jgi:hypothetical protein
MNRQISSIGYESNILGRGEEDRLAGGAAIEAVQHELAFAGVNTRTHGSVGLTRLFPMAIDNLLLTRPADNWLTRWAMGCSQDPIWPER